MVLLHWLYQNVLGNIVASLIWATPTIMWGRKHINRIHKSHDELHAKLSKVHEHLRIGDYEEK